MKKISLMILALTSLQVSALTHNHNHAEEAQLQLKTISADRLITVSKSGNGLKSFNQIQDLAPLSENITDGQVRSPQLYKGIPVYGSEVVYKVKNNNIEQVFGRLAQIDTLDINEKISKTSAIEIVQQQYASLQIESIQKMVYPAESGSLLVWKVIEDGFDRKLEILIDAQSGQIIDSFNSLNNHTHVGKGYGLNDQKRKLKFTKKNNVYTLKSSKHYKFETFDMTAYKGWNARFKLPGDNYKEADRVLMDKAATDAHFYTEKFLKHLSKRFDRSSYDGKGAPVNSSVHYGKEYVNAFWNGKQMVYGDGDENYSTHLSGGLDVIAHEITHGITTHTSNLTYRNESGALNEAFSDIMAAYAEFRIERKKFDWKVGEDIWTPGKEGDALRYMDNPTRDKERIPANASEARKELYSRDWYPERYQGTGDNGGVHINSGIANLAFVLLSDGGTHPRAKSDVKVKGIGIKKAIQIFYRAFTEYLVSSSTFADARKACIQAAVELYGQHQGMQVANAWAAVGVL